MGLPFEPGWGADLGSSLAGIATGVQKFIDPNKQFRTQFEQHLLTNPELSQRLADLEYQTPGAVTENMRQFLTPGASGLIRAVSPSMDARISRILRDNSDMLVHDPTLAQDIVSRAYTGRTPDQRTVDARNANVARVQNRGVNTYNQTATPTDLETVGEHQVDPLQDRLQNQFRVAQIRLQAARTPEEIMRMRMETMRFGHQLGLQDFAIEQDMRLSAEAQQNRPQWINSLRNTQTSLSSMLRAYNAHPDPTQLGVIQAQVQTLKDYYRLLGTTPPDINIGSKQGGIFGLGKTNSTLLDSSGNEIDPASLEVPSVAPTNPAPRTPNNPNPRNPRGNQPRESPALIGRMRAQAALVKSHPNITDAQLTTGGWTTDQIARIRRLAK